MIIPYMKASQNCKNKSRKLRFTCYVKNSFLN